MESSEPCPPHHWQITTAELKSGSVYHHTCLRCEAQKDLPVYALRTERPRPARTAAS